MRPSKARGMLHSGMSSDMGLAKLKCVLLLTVSDMIGLELDIVPSRPKWLRVNFEGRKFKGSLGIFDALQTFL